MAVRVVVRLGVAGLPAAGAVAASTGSHWHGGTVTASASASGTSSGSGTASAVLA